MTMLTGASVMAVIVASSTVAAAHIHMTFPLSRTDNPTGDQKVEHCGTAGWVRGDHAERIQTFLPGSTITVTWAETINHPGWFRISFQPDGEIFGIPPASDGPTGLGAPSNFPTASQEGLDPVNGSIVLADRIADGMLSMQVTLPNIECANCTLQFAQIMTDKAPYTVDAASDDIYFNCADLVLSATAPDAGPQPTIDAAPGSPDAGASDGGAPIEGGGRVGGCDATGAGVGPAVLLLGLVLRRRRRG